MIEPIREVIMTWPPELAVALLSALPLTELRASLPLAVTVFELNEINALTYSVLGSLIPLPFIFWLLPKVLELGKGEKGFLRGMLDRHVDKLEKKHKDRYDRYGWIILVVLVAIPLPGSGVWTGSTLAVLFRIERTYAIPAIVVGAIISGLIVLAITTGALRGLNFLI